MVTFYLSIVFGAIGIAACLAAAVSRQKRGAFAATAVVALAAALSAYYKVFWTTAVFGLCVPWALFCATSLIDLKWRLKAGFVLVTALGAILCLFPTYHDERFGKPPYDLAAAKAGESGFKKYVLANIPFRLVRGLDLKGGLRLEYTVEVEDAIRDKRDRYYDDLKVALAKLYGFTAADKPPTNEELAKVSDKAKFSKPADQVGAIVVTLTDPADAEKINDKWMEENRFKADLLLQKSADRKTLTFRIRSEIESAIRGSAVAQAKETVLKRVDALGLKEASVTIRDEDIIVEVPGDDARAFEEMKETISQVARLEFKMVDDNDDFFGRIQKDIKPETVKGLRFVPENAPVGPGKTRPVYVAEIIKGENEELRDTLRRFRDWIATLPVPDDHEVGIAKLVERGERGQPEEVIGWRSYYLYGKAELTGAEVRAAQARPDQSDSGVRGGWYVQMELTPKGADVFEDITGKNIKRRFAIILDDKIESAPVIQTKIGGGVASITMGSSSTEEQLRDARRLELVLNSGALPAAIVRKSEQLIGPSLGKDSIDQALKGASLGSGMVLVFMVVYYAKAGMIANIAVVFNLMLQLAILAMFGASMTLPGIAGLALTIGIGVDANVLITERLRDEVRAGKSPRAAVELGYDKAFSAILDGHVTTLISGLILAQYGSGPIKGFAVTLIVGIAVSLFTGVVCTRLLFDFAVRHRKVRSLSLGI